ncbi:MAG: S41 family peptidase [Firmicutes bacterium]|nr:S41 family peptidase [Bacillota bacterium]
MDSDGDRFKSRRGWLMAVLLFVIIVGTGLAAFQLGLVRGASSVESDPGFELDSPESLEEEWSIFKEVLERLQSSYLYPLDPVEIVRGAVRGVVEALGDPRTGFYDQQEFENFMIQTTGSFGGIGVRIVEVDSEIIVFETIPDSPAAAAGVFPGDRLCRAGGQLLTGEGLEHAAEILRGEKGSSVTLTIKRPGREEELELTLERDEVKVETVFSRWVEAGLGYIRIDSFDSRTGASFAGQLLLLETAGLRKGLILDLRDNPGGLVEEAVKVAKLIVPEGEITRLVGRGGKVRDIHYSNAQEKDYPILVLVNEESASAAEILAGALQESGAVLVGVKTYGKATVQHLEKLTGGGALLLTVARYLTPSGKDIDGKGLEPDVTVEMPSLMKNYRYFLPGRLSRDDYGADVKLLQEMLAELGYQCGREGCLDEATSAALDDFQTAAGLETTGEFDDLTWINLREAFEKIVRQRDPQLHRAVELLKTPGKLALVEGKNN